VPFCRYSRGFPMPSAVSVRSTPSMLNAANVVDSGTCTAVPRKVVRCHFLPILRHQHNVLSHCFFCLRGLRGADGEKNLLRREPIGAVQRLLCCNRRQNRCSKKKLKQTL